MIYRKTLMYPDFNATPWPLNHHAYIHAAAHEIRAEIPAVSVTVDLPEAHLQDRDIRQATITASRSAVAWAAGLRWTETEGWTYHLDLDEAAGLWLGLARIIAPPKHVARQFGAAGVRTGPRAAEPHWGTVARRPHPVDPIFERRLASFRLPAAELVAV